MLNPTEQKPSLNAATLSKALTKPPPLSSLLNSAPKALNGSLSTANSSLSSSPSIMQQQSQPIVGSYLVAQSQKSLELSAHSLNNSIQNLSLNNSNNQLSSTSTLFQNLPPQNLNKSLPHLPAQSAQSNGPIYQEKLPNNKLSSQVYGQTNSNLSSNAGLANPSSVIHPQYNQPAANMAQNYYSGPSATYPLQHAANQLSSNQFHPSAPPITQTRPILAPGPSTLFQQPMNPNLSQQTIPPLSSGHPPLALPQTRPIAPPIGPFGPNSHSAPPVESSQPVVQQTYMPPPKTAPPLGPPTTMGAQLQPNVLHAPPPTNYGQHSSQYINAVSQQNQGPPMPLINQPIQSQYNQNSINGRNMMPQYEQQPLQYQQLNNFQMRGQPNAIDLIREKKLLHAYEDEENDIPRPLFQHDFYTHVNCDPDTIRCTLSSMPETQQLLDKSRLPLGLLIHPFKDLESLKVVQSSIIVRCRNCRSYINPFVHFLDNSKWRCNLCYSVNDLPEEFLFDPVTRSYGDPSKRPEINSSTIEFIAPPEYTLRPPPPAMYLYLLDVSHNAINTGYLKYFCETLIENLDKIPGDSRAQIGFITYSSSVHFYNLSDSSSQTKMFVHPDLDEVQLPMPDGLMVNLNEKREGIQLFLETLPSLFADTYETDSALGTALTAGHQLLKPTGGRMTIMQTCLPNVGIGSLKQREENIDKESSNMAPQNDFYKKFALDCAGAQIAVDMFMLNSLNADLATLSCVSKYCAGEIKFYPGFHPDHHQELVNKFCVDLKRYLTRKIGFEAVMRIRCSRGLTIHSFHGNFFVRSTDLLALPNVNPDAGFGLQMNIEESLTDFTNVAFQAAVLYTSSKSERRIRIHTFCMPITKNMNEIVNGADQEAIVGLISKMAVDRTAMNSLKDARDAMINVAVDYLQAYKHHVTSSRSGSLISPYSLRLIPTFVLALMKNLAFKFGSIKMDERIYAMNLCKTLPLRYLILTIYPNLYAIHNLDDKRVTTDIEDGEVCIPPRLHLSSENIDRHGLYLMDCGEAIYMWVGRSISDIYLQEVFNVKSYSELPEILYELPDLDNELSEKVRQFIAYLHDSRPFGIKFLCFREGSHHSSLFFQYMHDDKTENSISYYEFLQHISDQLNK